MWLDILTIPAVMIICLNTNFPILFGILVSLWALADLGISLWVSRKLGMDDLLNDDVRTVTEKLPAIASSMTGRSSEALFL